MLTRLMVIQKLHTNGTLEVFQADSGIFHWTFESRRAQLSEDQRYFPFVLEPDGNIIRRRPAIDTGIVVKQDELIFSADYATPGGTVIAILFPPLFIPGDMTFKEKAYIPVGPGEPAAVKPPGQIEIAHNDLEKRCAIIFHIHKNSCFGFGCVSKKVRNQDYNKNVSVLRREVTSRKIVPDVWLCSLDVMRLLKINDRTLMRRRQNGSIPFSGERGNYLYRKSDIEKLLR